MDEIEVPLEKIQEDMHHALHHEGGGNAGFMNRAALLSAFLAVVAAISALFAGHFANEAMLEQIRSSDQWSYYQAKGIKLAIAELRNDSHPSKEAEEKIEGYKEDQKEIQTEAKEKEKESRDLLHKHESLAASVTLFQIAIAMTAISVLTRKRTFLFGSSILGFVGILWMIKSFLM